MEEWIKKTLYYALLGGTQALLGDIYRMETWKRS